MQVGAGNPAKNQSQRGHKGVYLQTRLERKRRGYWRKGQGLGGGGGGQRLTTVSMEEGGGKKRGRVKE